MSIEGQRERKAKKKTGTREIQIRKTRKEVRKPETWQKDKVGKQQMVTNRGRPRNMGKAGDKVDFKNTLDKYNLSEKKDTDQGDRNAGNDGKNGKNEKRIRGNDKGNKRYIREASGEDEKGNERGKRKRGKTESQRERRMGKGKKEFLNRIKRIEEEQDKAEREKRRRNIVIKGVDWNEGSNEETVKEFIREKIRIGAEVERTHMIRVGDKNVIIVATMKSIEKKIRTMKEKSKLEKWVYIDDDLARKEREVQQHIRRVARVRREQAEYVKIKYKKLKY